MTFDAFSNSLMLLILSSFIVERSLAVIFETRFYIQRYGTNKAIKPVAAIVFAIVYVVAFDINISDVMRQSDGGIAQTGYSWSGDIMHIIQNAVIILVSAIFIAGGSKASLKLFRDVWKIKSADEAMRTAEIKAVPANPIKAVEAAANGNTNAENMLYTLFDESGIAKAG